MGNEREGAAPAEPACSARLGGSLALPRITRFFGKKTASSCNSTHGMTSPPAAGEALPAPDDSQLLHEIRRGSESAFAELVRRHGPDLYALAQALVRHQHDPEDLVQEVFLAVLSAKFHGRSS